MYQAIADAIADRNYAKAEDLIVMVGREAPDNPWLDYYRASLAEAQGELNHAEHQFRQLLAAVSNPQLSAKIRRGLARIQQIHQAEKERSLEQRQSAIQAAKAEPGAEAVAVFVLEPVTPEMKRACAVQFGKIMQMDAYSARLQLPSRTWRLFRSGGIGELRYFQQQCQAVGIPTFCVPVQALHRPKVYPVFSLQTLDPQGTVTYRVNREEQETFTFNWSEIEQWVEGQLPTFEESVNIDVRGKIERKTALLHKDGGCQQLPFAHS